MIRNTKALLEYQIKKNSRLKYIVENLNDISKEEIEKEKFPKWIREYLFKEKETNYVVSNIMSNIKIIESFTPEIYGTTVRWIYGSSFISLDRGGALEVKDNELLFLPNDGGVYIKYCFSSLIDPRIKFLRPIEHMTRTQYLAKHSEENRLSIDGPTQDYADDRVAKYSNISNSGVRFY